MARFDQGLQAATLAMVDKGFVFSDRFVYRGVKYCMFNFPGKLPDGGKKMVKLKGQA